VTARLTPQAERDIDQILEHTLTSFGLAQFRKYESLLDQAIADIAGIPFRPGSKARPELGERYRSWHVQLTGKRRGAAAHLIFYYCLTTDPSTDIAVLRILHERMDPELHLSASGGQ
jgi:toxin ParE1/3/4